MTKNIGTDRLLDLILTGPSPLDKGGGRRSRVLPGLDEAAVALDPTASCRYSCSRPSTTSSQAALTWRASSGRIATDSQLLNIRTGEKERTGNILLMRGKETKGVDEAAAGDIVALRNLRTQARATL